ncbi:MAG: P27 family phage terminase small subunit [Vicinamibacteria bacterium]
MPQSPPSHLSADVRKWWSYVVSEYQLEAHHVRLLTAACGAWDRANEARRILAKEGIIVHDRWGQPKAHPAVAIERDSRIAFARLLRELGLDDGPAELDTRPPRVGGK